MEYKEIEPGIFLTSDFCIWYKKKEIIILADLHVGYDHSLLEKGISIPGSQNKLIIERLSHVFNRYHPQEVVVVGDFKHSFSGDDKRELWDMYDMIDYITEKANLTLIRGNHDNYLQTIASKKGIPFFENELQINGLTLSHGHGKVDHKGLLVMGHEHPSVKIRDEAGGVINFPCFLYHPLNNVVILPAFNPLFEGRDMLSGGGFMSQQLKTLSLEDFFVYPITDQGLMDFRTVAEVRDAIPRLI